MADFDWAGFLQGAAPLGAAALGYATSRPETKTSTNTPQFLSGGAQGIYNQGVAIANTAGAQPYAANDWIRAYQQMLGETATDPTVGDVLGQTAETYGALSNQLGSMPGGSNWNAVPGAARSAILNNMNPWNEIVTQNTMDYATEAAERAAASDRARAAQNMSGFGDRSQIAMELANDKRQRTLNDLRSTLDQQGFANAQQQSNVNNALGRADITQQMSLAGVQPQLAQMYRNIQLDNARQLASEGFGQRQYPWDISSNLINAGTKSMGSQQLSFTPNNPWKDAASAGLAAFSPAFQGAIGSGVRALGSVFGGAGGGGNAMDAFADGAGLGGGENIDWDIVFGGGDSAGYGDAVDSGAGFFEDWGFARGGRARRFKHGGIARFEDGGSAEEEDEGPIIDVVPTQVAEAPPSEEAPPQPSPPARPTGGIVLGGAARRGQPMPAVPAQATPATRSPVTVGGQDLEAEYIRRLMAGPDPAEMRTARDDERRAMSDLLQEYKPQEQDWRRNLADLGVGMAAADTQSLGKAFAQGVGYMQQGADQRSNLERQARRELAQIQLKMSSENRKELTDAERTRLTTLAQMIRERNSAAERREIADENRRSREDIARDQLSLRRDALEAQNEQREQARLERADREFSQRTQEWDAMAARQEPVWRRAALAASANVHPEDAPAFIEDYVQRQREAFEQRTPRPTRTPVGGARTQVSAGVAAPAPSPAGVPAPAASAPAPTPGPVQGAPAPVPPTPATPAQPAPTSAPPTGATDPRLGFRPRPPGPGDAGETTEVARRLNVPALTNPPWRGLSPRKTEELIIKERQDFLKLDDDREKDIGQAERIEQLGREFASLNERSETGGWLLNTPLVQQAMVIGDRNLQRMRSITAELAPLNRIVGTGAVSDFDAKQLVEQAPSIEKSPAANKMIIQYRLMAAQNLREKAAFDRAYFEANQTMQGARAAWDEYSKRNPLAVETKRGSGSDLPPFELVQGRMSWQEYFRMKDLESRQGGRR